MASSKPSTNQDIINDNEIDSKSSELITNKNTRKRRRTTSTVLNISKTNNDKEEFNEENLRKKQKILPVVKRGRGRPPKNSNSITTTAKSTKSKLITKNLSKNRQQKTINQKILSPSSSKPSIQPEQVESNEIQIIIPVGKEGENKDIPCTSSTRYESSLNNLNNDNDFILNVIEASLASTSTSSNIEYKSAKSTNKLMKSLTTKSKSSNLQKNKLSCSNSCSTSPPFNDNLVVTAKESISATINTINNNKFNVNINEEIIILENNVEIINNVNTNLIYSRQEELYNNANLFYKNYYNLKSDKLNNELIKYYDNNGKLENVQTQIIEMKTPLPSLNWANNIDIWKLMRLKDLQYYHDCNYLTNKHKAIHPYMRSMLVDWLAEITHAYRLHRETFHLSLEYMDRFMTLCKNQMKVDRLQLIGLCSLYLASKVEEIYPPKLKDFASHLEQYSNNNDDAMQQFELFILKTLNWQISPVTANTWLMVYLQIAAINYQTLMANINDPKNRKLNENENIKIFNAHVVMPLNIYKNSNFNLKDYLKQSNKNNNNNSCSSNNQINSVNMKFTTAQQNFYLNNFMKTISLIDLCLFDIESLRFNYSILAASALYHMVSLPKNSNSSSDSLLNQNNNESIIYFIEQCTGYKFTELDCCIRWMIPYADTCKIVLTEEKMVQVKQFSNIDPEDAHNIQIYYQYNDLLVSYMFFFCV
jgi:hypothetical protein